ncbi:MAG TPA: energy transducer TonB [Flavobacterium sp.]|jgi:protein TonB
MSNISIYGKKWLDLVFEGRNKEYGAYQLRQQNPRTTLFAMFYGILFMGSIGSGAMLLSSFGTKPVVVAPPELPHVTKVHLDDDIVVPVPEPLKKKADAPVKQDTPVETWTSDPEIVTRNDNPVDVTNQATTPVDPDPGVLGGTANNGSSNGSAAAPDVPTVGAGNTNGLFRRTSLDKLPEFPGGIQKFYNYVGNNFEKPQINEMMEVRVVVSFVIEKDGSMTDIKVIENPGNGLDREAIRVLRSLRTKWIPGIKDGQAVRTYYTLPIIVTK